MMSVREAAWSRSDGAARRLAGTDVRRVANVAGRHVEPTQQPKHPLTHVAVHRVEPNRRIARPKVAAPTTQDRIQHSDDFPDVFITAQRRRWVSRGSWLGSLALPGRWSAEQITSPFEVGAYDLPRPNSPLVSWSDAVAHVANPKSPESERFCRRCRQPPCCYAPAATPPCAAMTKAGPFNRLSRLRYHEPLGLLPDTVPSIGFMGAASARRGPPGRVPPVPPNCVRMPSSVPRGRPAPLRNSGAVCCLLP